MVEAERTVRNAMKIKRLLNIVLTHKRNIIDVSSDRHTVRDFESEGLCSSK